MRQRIVAVHLLNDRSGSPLVLRQALEALQDRYDITIYTATPSGDGCLNDLSGAERRPIFYRWHAHKLVTLFFFMLSQLLLFMRLLFALRRTDIVYINTLLPFGAALAGRFRGCKVICHIHETSLRPRPLKALLLHVASRTASQVFFVSAYVADHYSFPKQETHIIYNALPADFIQKASAIPRLNLKQPFTVTMLCSRKAYKGIYHFVAIARKLPQLQFQLVLNTTPREAEQFRQESNAPSNCIIYPAQRQTLPFYEKAHVVMNLSKPDGWVETFGMTLLEAMHCGRPVICPTTGGVLELVRDQVEGLVIDSAQEDRICTALERLSSDFGYYKNMSSAATARAQDFSQERFRKQLLAAFPAQGHSTNGTLTIPFLPEYGKN